MSVSRDGNENKILLVDFLYAWSVQVDDDLMSTDGFICNMDLSKYIVDSETLQT